MRSVNGRGGAPPTSRREGLQGGHGRVAADAVAVVPAAVAATAAAAERVDAVPLLQGRRSLLLRRLFLRRSGLPRSIPRAGYVVCLRLYKYFVIVDA